MKRIEGQRLLSDSEFVGRQAAEEFNFMNGFNIVMNKEQVKERLGKYFNDVTESELEQVYRMYDIYKLYTQLWKLTGVEYIDKDGNLTTIDTKDVINNGLTVKYYRIKGTLVKVYRAEDRAVVKLLGAVRRKEYKEIIDTIQ